MSRAGGIWETLVAYYLNLCYAGTDVLVVRRGRVPQAIAQALKVSHGPAALTADVDAIALRMPSQPALSGASDAAIRRAYDLIWENEFGSGSAVLMACKTNWNDTIQIPVLWNLLYRARRHNEALPSGLSIGSGFHSIDQLSGFSFAFVTEASNGPASFRNGTAPVERSKTMTGGTFWGHKSVPNVCLSMEEFFANQATHAKFPNPGVAGVAAAREANERLGVVDIDAFDLL